jgi:hypothetical protein
MSINEAKKNTGYHSLIMCILMIGMTISETEIYVD